MAATQHRHPGGWVGMGCERECGELQADQPALRALYQPIFVLYVKTHPHDLLQEEASLLLADPQVAVADLGHLSPCAPARECERRINATGEEQVQAGGSVIEQEAERGVDAGLFDQVIVIHNEHDLLPTGGQVIDQ